MKKPSAMKLRVYRTRIDGRRAMLRVGRVVIDGAFTWGVPWGKYLSPVFVKVQRTRFGVRLGLRIWQPYAKIDLQLLPQWTFEGNGPPA